MNKSLILNLIIAVFFISCNGETNNRNNEPKDKTIKIAISKAEGSQGYLQYNKWIKSFGENIETYSLYSLKVDSAIKVLNNCDGLIISGGPDVNPEQYNKANEKDRCGSIDYNRDTLEIALINAAIKNKQAILGICRGLQILNVSMGGSLIIDIPSDFDTIIKHRCTNAENCFHNVNIVDNNFLRSIIDTNQAKVNSNHHQAIDNLADELIAVAYSNDSLVEAIEWKNPTGKAFLIGVQWHPERMDSKNPASVKIGDKFIEACKLYSENQNIN